MRIKSLAVLALFPILLLCKKNITNPEAALYVWSRSTPADQGMRADKLDSALAQAQTLKFVDGLVIIRNSYIVSEKYYNGFTASQPHDTKSVSKSFLSALFGIALQQGIVDSLDEKVLVYFPEFVAPQMDPRKHLITLRHLLTMRMGIDDEANNSTRVYPTGNWLKTIWELPLLNDPGQRMLYSTFQTHLLAVILAKASGMNTFDLMKKLLTDPMAITLDHWMQDPQGWYYGGGGMHFTPREMAALGQMYLNKGKLHGKQIVPRDWVEFSLQPSTQFQPNSWGSWKNYNYAWLWWLGEMNDQDLFLAYGWGGQFIACFPALHLIIVTTANGEVDSETSTTQEWALFDIMTRYILPAVIG